MPDGDFLRLKNPNKYKKFKNCKFCKLNAKIRGVEILENIPLHLETIQQPIVKPQRSFLGSCGWRNLKFEKHASFINKITKVLCVGVGSSGVGVTSTAGYGGNIGVGGGFISWCSTSKNRTSHDKYKSPKQFELQQFWKALRALNVHWLIATNFVWEQLKNSSKLNLAAFWLRLSKVFSNGLLLIWVKLYKHLHMKILN